MEISPDVRTLLGRAFASHADTPPPALAHHVRSAIPIEIVEIDVERVLGGTMELTVPARGSYSIRSKSPSCPGHLGHHRVPQPSLPQDRSYPDHGEKVPPSLRCNAWASILSQGHRIQVAVGVVHP